MRSRLHNGKIRPPASRAEATALRRQLFRECERIRDQLIAREPPRTAEWKERAAARLQAFLEEARQLGEWIASSDASFLRQAHELLKTVDFDPPESDFVRRLDHYFAENKKGPPK